MNVESEDRPTVHSYDQPFHELDHTFIISYQNVRGLNTKVSDFYNNVCLTQNEYDMIAVSETWVNDSVYDNELIPENFLVYKNRNREDHMQGGGVLVAVKKTYTSVMVDLVCSSTDIDAVAVKINTSDFNYIYVINIYIAPSCSVFKREEFFSYIESLEYLYQNKFIIVGDFNVTHLNDYYIHGYRDQFVNVVLSLIDFFDCKQLNRIQNKNGRILDVVITKYECKVYTSAYSFVVIDPHHPPLTVEIELINPKQKYLIDNTNSSNYNFKKADFPAMYHLFQNVCWNDLKLYTNIDLAVKWFYDKIYEIFELSVPKSKPSPNYPVWFNKTIITNIKIKDKLRLRSRKTANVEIFRQFNELRAKIKQDIRTAHNQYVNKIQLDISEDPETFWQFIKNKKKFNRYTK